MNSEKRILDDALTLEQEERLLAIERLLKNLDELDKKLDKICADEVERRLKTHGEKGLEGIPMEQIFKQEK